MPLAWPGGYQLMHLHAQLVTLVSHHIRLRVYTAGFGLTGVDFMKCLLARFQGLEFRRAHSRDLHWLMSGRATQSVDGPIWGPGPSHPIGGGSGPLACPGSLRAEIRAPRVL